MAQRTELIPLKELVKEAGDSQPLILGQYGDGTAIVNLETGQVAPVSPPTNKLKDAGKLRLIQLILAGEDDADIAKIIVDEGYVTSYTVQAVAYWRERPQVQEALATRHRRAFQVGWASKEVRVNKLSQLAEALEEAILQVDPRDPTGRRKILRTGQAIQYQAVQIKEYRETLLNLAALVDDPVTAKVDVKVAGGLEHSHTAAMLGMPVNETTESLRERLRRAADIIDVEATAVEELPPSMIGAKSKSSAGDED